ncbi:MAG: phage tail spike protein [Acutalibacteraceae bacterium]|nr:phage tail spike protein [Acutalibacteraceae bacterium]
MYKITLKPKNETRIYTLHDLTCNNLVLINPKLSLALNKTGTLTFNVPATHPYYDKIAKMQCEITVYKNNKIIYVGRPLNSDEDFYKTSSVTCEGILAYLIDSIQRPYTYNGNIHGFFSALLENHNNYMGNNSYKKFTLGICDVADSNNYINRSDSNYTNTLNTLNQKLIATHGGYLGVRFENNMRYLDYKSQAGKQNKQIIRFADNLLDLTRYIKSDNLITAIIPLGAETTEEGINNTKKRVTIESVNNGKDYLVDDIAVEQFGLIYGTVEFDDVTLPSNLKTKAQKYLDENKNLSLTIELSAVDLSVLNADIEGFCLGDYVRVISAPHNLDSYFLLSEYEIDLVDPSQNTITLGKTLSKLSSTVNKNQSEATINLIKQTNALNADIENAVENATNLITGNNGGYLYIKKNEDGQPEELYILDTPAIDDAQNVIRLNKNGFGFSHTGYNGTFTNAWTIDGSLVADFITTGSLNASLIKTGKITSATNDKIYFDLTSGELSGSVLTDPVQSSDLMAKFESTTIDGFAYNGLIIYDRNNTDSSSDILDVGGIIRYQDNTDSSNIGLYSRGQLILSGYGLSGSGSSVVLDSNSVYIDRRVAEDEGYTTENTTVFSATADELYVNYFKTTSEYSYLRFTDETTSLFKQFPPTTGTGTDSNCGIYLEKGTVGITINDNAVFKVTSSGATVNGVTVTSDRNKKRNISRNTTNMLDKVKNIKIYDYKLLDDEDDEVQRYGFMADELPDKMLADDKKSVDLYGALAVAIKAIQDLNAIVEKLEQKVKELKSNG